MGGKLELKCEDLGGAAVFSLPVNYELSSSYDGAADSSYPEVAAWYKTHVDAFSDKTSSSCAAFQLTRPLPAPRQVPAFP